MMISQDLWHRMEAELLEGSDPCELTKQQEHRDPPHRHRISMT
jgi:hypothetical protein